MSHYCYSCGRWELLDLVTALCGVCLAAWQALKSGSGETGR